MTFDFKSKISYSGLSVLLGHPVYDYNVIIYSNILIVTNENNINPTY